MVTFAPWKCIETIANGRRCLQSGIAHNANLRSIGTSFVAYGDATFDYTSNGELLTKTDGTGMTTYDDDVFDNLLGVVLSNGMRLDTRWTPGTGESKVALSSGVVVGGGLNDLYERFSGQSMGADLTDFWWRNEAFITADDPSYPATRSDCGHSMVCSK